MEKCAVVMKENVDAHIYSLGSAIRANYMALFTCALILVAALLVSFMMLRLAVSLVSNYRALVVQNAATPTTGTHTSTSPGAAATNDDVVYADEAADAATTSGLASNLQDSDNSRVKATLVTLKNKYAQYNAAMSDYATRVQYRTPDDLMDETILSRGNDDFRYTPDAQEI